MTKSKRVGLYLRVSTDEQSVESQRSELVRFVEARGWTIANVFEDVGFSGGNLNRPGFNALMKAAKARRLDLVLCFKVDRISRSLKDLVVTLHSLTELGVEFCALGDNIDTTTSAGRAMLGLLGVFAELERETIVARVKSGMEAAKRRGVRIGRPKKRDDGKIRSLRSKGHSIRQIAKLTGVSTQAVQRSLKSV